MYFVNVSRKSQQSVTEIACDVVYRLQLSLLKIGGTGAASRRRMADVRSLGYSELFVLSKDDLWNVLEEFPEAKEKMIEAGKERLRQDGLLSEQVT